MGQVRWTRCLKAAADEDGIGNGLSFNITRVNKLKSSSKLDTL